MAKSLSRIRRWPLIGALVILIAFVAWLKVGIESSSPGPNRYYRNIHPARLSAILEDLHSQGIVKNTTALRLYAIFARRPQSVPEGTFLVGPTMPGRQILQSLSQPIRQNVRIPETNWANRTAHLLANKQVLNADEYMDLVRHPAEFQSQVDFPLTGTSLEGYLYPDTYDLPPLLGAKAVITEQLKDFDRKVWKKIQPNDLQRILTIASMVQMESGRTRDLPMIAGVIENRLKQNMPLQIDSTLLYGIQKWRRLTFADYHGIHSAYNTYTHKGLPPGPICSPTFASIQAALNPAKHDYLYYVALPDGESIYSKDYEEHLKKIRIRMKELAKLKRETKRP